MNDKLPEDRPPADSSFLNLLQNHRRGQVLNDIGQAMRSVVDAALLTGKPGGVTIRILIAPTNSGAVEIQDDIKTTMPKARKTSTLFFLDEAGVMVRNDPNQLEIPLRSVEGGKTVDVETLRKVQGNQP